jgi:hypothetical protein
MDGVRRFDASLGGNLLHRRHRLSNPGYAADRYVDNIEHILVIYYSHQDLDFVLVSA